MAITVTATRLYVAVGTAIVEGPPAVITAQAIPPSVGGDGLQLPFTLPATLGS